jgi:hypothetical protein
VCYVDEADAEPRARWRFWVAPDRNYLVAKSENYLVPSSDEHPIARYEVLEWLEVEPGIWSPSHAVKTSYHDPTLHPGEDGAIVSVTTEFKVHEVNLRPDYSREFFSDIAMPVGVTVYRIVNGEIVDKSIIEPEHGRSAARWLIIANLVGGAGIACCVTVSRWRRAARGRPA